MCRCRCLVVLPLFFWVLPRENLHSLKKSYVGAIVFQKVLSRRQSFYGSTMNYCRFFHSKLWNFLGVIIFCCKMNEISIFSLWSLSFAHDLFTFSTFWFFDASNFSIFHFLRLLELQFWAFEAPMWLPWLPFAASLACLLRIWNIFALSLWKWGGKQARQASKQERNHASKQPNKQSHTQTSNQTITANNKISNQASKQTRTTNRTRRPATFNTNT